MDHKKRGLILTILIVLAILSLSSFLISFFLKIPGIVTKLTDDTEWVRLALGGIIFLVLAELFFYIKLWEWKKIGFYGLFTIRMAWIFIEIFFTESTLMEIYSHLFVPLILFIVIMNNWKKFN